MFSMAKFVVTIFVIGVPSIAGSFQSAKVQQIKVMQIKGIIREEIHRFLLRHPEFYKYPLPPPSATSSEGSKTNGKNEDQDANLLDETGEREQ